MKLLEESRVAFLENELDSWMSPIKKIGVEGRAFQGEEHEKETVQHVLT